jgi:hypothetical protein
MTTAAAAEEVDREIFMRTRFLKSKSLVKKNLRCEFLIDE